MISAQPNIPAAQQDRFGTVAPENDFLVPDKTPAGDSFLPAEPEHLRPRRRTCRGRWIIRVDDGRVILGLIFEHPHFRAPVGFERAVAVQMVRSEIEEHGDIWAECGNRFELETAGFDDSEPYIARHIHAGDQRRADVSGDLHGRSGGFQNMADQ